MADSTLTAIKIKARRLTRSPSIAQLTEAELEQYINTFILYDFPEHLRLFNLRTTLTFFTEPYIDVYETSTDVDSPLYNFKNRYLTIHPPIYIAGYQTILSQSREQFFGMYPMINFISSIGTTGDGIQTLFTGVLPNAPVLRNQVLFNSIDAANDGIEVHDDGNGTLVGDGDGLIDYVTGQFSIIFNTAPGPGAAINSQTVPYQASRPQALLFYDTKFTLRPVPDQVYRVNMEAYIRPTELLASNQSPELEEFWQYIALGAARKILQDRLDMDTVNLIDPEFREQESLILRRTIVQQTNERTATIYINQSNNYGGNGWNGTGFY